MCADRGICVEWNIALDFGKQQQKKTICILNSAKLRQPTGQSQDNFNFGPSPLKGAFSKPSGKLILGPDFCLLR